MSDERLLAGAGPAPVGLADHRAIHGELGLAAPEGLLAAIERVRLRGRGGGGFPLAQKLAAIRRGRGEPVVIVNACEGDPLSAKDRVLIGHVPHLVLDGAITLARLIGAGELYLAVDETTPASEALAAALAARPEARRGLPAIALTEVPPGYVSGQETALVRFLQRGDARPLASSPRVAERGLGGRPTLVTNVETVSHVALLVHHGADWYEEVGVPGQPGTALVTVTGAVPRPGVREVRHGEPLTAILTGAGADPADVEAVLVGGCAGTWVPARRLRALTLDDRSLAQVGARVGLGAISVLPVDACPVAELARSIAWLADRSTGQCGPCVNGLAAIAGAISGLRDGTAPPGVLEELERWCGLVERRGACSHPDGTAAFVRSGLAAFAPDLEDHHRNGRCELCDAPGVLPLPGALARS